MGKRTNLFLCFIFSQAVRLYAHPAKISSCGAYPVTVVCGYWKISSKHSARDYGRWFSSSLLLNVPYVIYYEDEGVRLRFSKIRAGLPTAFVKQRLSQFRSTKLYNSTWTHPVHVPTVDVGAIWTEKTKLLLNAALHDPFKSDWFAWVDAGNAAYRDSPPPPTAWPLASALSRLPLDKVVYSGTLDFYHDFAGTAFLYHRSIAAKVDELFLMALQVCATDVNDWHCGNDQYLFTQLRDTLGHGDLFYRMGVGYGEIVIRLFTNEEPQEA